MKNYVFKHNDQLVHVMYDNNSFKIKSLGKVVNVPICPTIHKIIKDMESPCETKYIDAERRLYNMWLAGVRSRVIIEE